MLSTVRRAFVGPARQQIRSASLARLLSSLAILEQRNGQLNTGSLSSVTAAKKLGGSVHAFVAGSGVKAVADEVAKIDGIEKVVIVDSAAYEKVRKPAHTAKVLQNGVCFFCAY